MRGILISFTIIIIMIGTFIYFGDNDFTRSTESISLEFLGQLLSADPDTNSKISDDEIVNKTNIEKYISSNYSRIATEEMMKELYESNYIMLSSDIAEETNSKIIFDQIVITKKYNSEGRVYINFMGVTKVKSADSLDEFIYPLTGEIGLVEDRKIMKVDTLELFTNELINHKL